MNTSPCSNRHHGPRVIVRGVHLWLTEAMKTSIARKAGRLFRHEPRILRLRVDVVCDHRRGIHAFTAKGRVEMPGPDLSAAVTTDHGYRSISLLMDKLDRMLRKRMTGFFRRRAGDIREFPAMTVSAR